MTRFFRRLATAGGDPAGGCGGRNVGSELGGVRYQLVAQCLDQRVQTAPGTAGVVDTPAGVRAAVRPVGRAAATSPAAVGAAAPPDMGWRQSAVGLDRDLTASVGSTQHHNLRIPRNAFANGLPAARPRRKLGCSVLKLSRTG